MLLLTIGWYVLPSDDKNRCRLKSIPGTQGSDYINASSIDVCTLTLFSSVWCVHCVVRDILLSPSASSSSSSSSCSSSSSPSSPSSKGYHRCKEFIATQGPLPDTENDFWRMIWEKKCSTIVMLTKEHEEDKASQPAPNIPSHPLILLLPLSFPLLPSSPRSSATPTGPRVVRTSTTLCR